MGVGSSKETVEDKGVLVGRVLLTQIPKSIPMKLVVLTSTMNPSQDDVDLSKVKKKGISINEGGACSSSKMVKIIPTTNPKDK